MSGQYGKNVLYRPYNYRPITILCPVSKILERLIFNHLYNYIKGQIDDSQHGFVPKHLTNCNLLEYVHRVVEAIANGGQIDTIFTDFSKAFY